MDLAPPRRTHTLAIVTTSPYQVALFLEATIQMLPSDIRPLIFTNADDQYRDLLQSTWDVRHVPLSRVQRISQSDVRSGIELRRAFKVERVRSLVTMSPKAGFIGQLAGRAAGVDRRLHIFTGQVWEGMQPSAKRSAVMMADRVIGRAATHLAADSPSQAANLIAMKVAPRRRGVVVPSPAGSIRGVDLGVFHPMPAERGSLRSRLGLSVDSVAFVQLGRISHAKGVIELREAFGRLRSDWRAGRLALEPRLFLVGQDEQGLSRALTGDGVEILPFTHRPELVLAAMDVLVLASHREGFGSTIIEAAAMSIPAIGTDINGVKDAIFDGVTGWLTPRADPRQLHRVLDSVARDPGEVQRRGRAALERARRDFDSERVTRAWADLISDLHERRTP